MNRAKTKYLKDYTPPSYNIKHTNLVFDLFEEYAIVTNEMIIQKLSDEPLVLNGEKLELNALFLDYKAFSDYEVDEFFLTIKNTPDEFNLTIKTTIYPQNNLSLDGLYRSNGMFCTQNEPEGFRKITYFLDRPDVLSRFRVKIIADRYSYPILLSNGNFVEKGHDENNRHYAIWEDPFLKPTYLFALVAGDLGYINDSFTTISGRDIALNIYCDKGNESKCAHAMTSLQASMKWDEDVYGREYDLEIYNIVAVDSFNMGAMENKGLNIFNSHYVLASNESATDRDFMGIESVIAHEYFHNWSGNRVTCRDWFQLTLKEGFTVFRDQCFSADMNSSALQRIDDVKSLCERQFLEDASGTAHPIKPDHYIEINNFYTSTVYEKGAEVIRMIYTMMGKENFRRACDFYFDTFDGKAVTTEDFLDSMKKFADFDLEYFKLWYSQERTPELIVEESYDETNKKYLLKLTQRISNSVDGKAQKPHYYPLKFGLLDQNGSEIELEKNMLIISKESQTFEFENIASKPTLSINRDFSAPIKVIFDADDQFLMKYDSDSFNRYESAQNFAIKTIKEIIKTGNIDQNYLNSYRHILQDESIESAFKADLLDLPSYTILIQTQEVVDVEPLYVAVESLKQKLAHENEELLLDIYANFHKPSNDQIDSQSVAFRALKNRVLALLMRLKKHNYIQLCIRQYYESVTMNDKIVALDLLENYAPQFAASQLADFYLQYRDNTLIMNKYLSIISASLGGAIADEGVCSCCSKEDHVHIIKSNHLERVKKLQDDPVYDIKVPNLVRSLIGVFARNYLHFHATDGSGYNFVADKIICLDAINPQIAAGLSGAFKLYPKMNENAKTLMKNALLRVLKTPNLSKNVQEIVEKILDIKE